MSEHDFPFSEESNRKVWARIQAQNQEIIDSRSCPLEFPEPCSQLFGGPFGEYAQAQLNGYDLSNFQDIQGIIKRCAVCRDFVEQIKESLVAKDYSEN